MLICSQLVISVQHLSYVCSQLLTTFITTIPIIMGLCTRDWKIHYPFAGNNVRQCIGICLSLVFCLTIAALKCRLPNANAKKQRTEKIQHQIWKHQRSFLHATMPWPNICIYSISKLIYMCMSYPCFSSATYIIHTLGNRGTPESWRADSTICVLCVTVCFAICCSCFWGPPVSLLHFAVPVDVCRQTGLGDNNSWRIFHQPFSISNDGAEMKRTFGNRARM